MTENEMRRWLAAIFFAIVIFGFVIAHELEELKMFIEAGVSAASTL